jgi:hypothetical protein
MVFEEATSTRPTAIDSTQLKEENSGTSSMRLIPHIHASVYGEQQNPTTGGEPVTGGLISRAHTTHFLPFSSLS